MTKLHLPGFRAGPVLHKDFARLLQQLEQRLRINLL
jgi:hypothetical protein